MANPKKETVESAPLKADTKRAHLELVCDNKSYKIMWVEQHGINEKSEIVEMGTYDNKYSALRHMESMLTRLIGKWAK